MIIEIMNLYDDSIPIESLLLTILDNFINKKYVYIIKKSNNEHIYLTCYKNIQVFQIVNEPIQIIKDLMDLAISKKIKFRTCCDGNVGGYCYYRQFVFDKINEPQNDTSI